MFDLGWTELLLIGIVALIVVGPKDLPVMFRTLGRFTGKARAMARDFQKAMNDAADEAGVKDVASDLRKATSAKSMGLDRLQEAATKFENWSPEDNAKSDPADLGPATAKMTEERAEKARKIQEATARKATERLEREAEAAAQQEAAAQEIADAKPEDAK